MKRVEVSWAPAFIPHCFPNTDSMWPAASSSCAVFPAVMGRAFKLWAEIDPFLPQLLLFGIFFSQQREKELVAHFTESSTGRKGCMHGGLGVVGWGWGDAGVLPPTYVVLWLKFSFVQARGPEGGPYITQALSGHCYSPPCSLGDPSLLRHTTAPPHNKGRKTYLPDCFILHGPLSRPQDCPPLKQY